MRRSYKRFAHYSAEADAVMANASSCHPAALPGLLQRALDHLLTAADYGRPDERAEARARAGQVAAQLAIVLSRPEERPRFPAPSAN